MRGHERDHDGHKEQLVDATGDAHNAAIAALIARPVRHWRDVFELGCVVRADLWGNAHDAADLRYGIPESAHSHHGELEAALIKAVLALKDMSPDRFTLPVAPPSQIQSTAARIGWLWDFVDIQDEVLKGKRGTVKRTNLESITSDEIEGLEDALVASEASSIDDLLVLTTLASSRFRHYADQVHSDHDVAGATPDFERPATKQTFRSVERLLDTILRCLVKLTARSPEQVGMRAYLALSTKAPDDLRREIIAAARGVGSSAVQ